MGQINSNTFSYAGKTIPEQFGANKKKGGSRLSKLKTQHIAAQNVSIKKSNISSKLPRRNKR